MEGSIKGNWPGGPKRSGSAPERTRPPQLQRVEEIEARIAARSMRLKRGRKKKRLTLALAFSVVVAGIFGWALGLRSHTTLQEINVGRQAQQQRDSDISSEINRVMLELWRMEEVEFSRNRSGR